MKPTEEFCYVLESVSPDDAGLSFYLTVGSHRLGRQDVDLNVPKEGISRDHCDIEVLEDGGVVIRDLDSTNGTRVNGRRITRCAIQEHASIEFGDHLFRLLPYSSEELGLLFADDSSASEPQYPHNGAITIRPNAHLDLWSASFEVFAQDANTDEPPIMDWLTAVAGILGQRSIELRNAEDDSVYAAIGLNQQTAYELTRSDHWVLYGNAEGQVPDSLAQILAKIPRPDHKQPTNHKEPMASLKRDCGTVQPELRRQLLDARRVAQGPLSLLLMGDSGTGKEWTARWLHDSSPRSSQPFFAINCAAIPAELLEAELFGIESGVATGVEARSGVIAQSHGGTLFLDEVGEMPAALQAKVLRVLDTGEIVPVGGRTAKSIDLRLISATNRDIKQAIADGGFRKDLYYRIAAHVLDLPLLKDRLEDLPGLISRFYRDACHRQGQSVRGITKRAVIAMLAFPWPGNIRQLRTTIERAVLLVPPGQPLDLPQLPDELINKKNSNEFRLRSRVEQAESTALRAAVQAAEGDITEACRLLDIGRSTFYEKARKLDINFSSDMTESDG